MTTATPTKKRSTDYVDGVVTMKNILQKTPYSNEKLESLRDKVQALEACVRADPGHEDFYNGLKEAILDYIQSFE